MSEVVGSQRPLDGRVAVVSGASSGIGGAIARAFVAGGARVVLNARRRDRLEALAGELGDGRTAVVPGDASEDASVTAMLDAAEARFARPADLVVVNAGRGLKGSVFDSDPAQWEEMVRTNLLGAARLMRAAAHRMVAAGPDASAGGGGAWLERPRDIVVIGSSVGKNISPFSSMYGSTKFGVGALSEALRRELGPKGIRVTLIAPAVVRSEFQAVAGYDPAGFGQFMEKIGPVLSPEDVARTVVFVASQPAHVHLNDIMLRPTRQDYP